MSLGALYADTNWINFFPLQKGHNESCVCRRNNIHSEFHPRAVSAPLLLVTVESQEHGSSEHSTEHFMDSLHQGSHAVLTRKEGASILQVLMRRIPEGEMKSLTKIHKTTVSVRTLCG